MATTNTSFHCSKDAFIERFCSLAEGFQKKAWNYNFTFRIEEDLRDIGIIKLSVISRDFLGIQTPIGEVHCSYREEQGNTSCLASINLIGNYKLHEKKVSSMIEELFRNI